MSGILKKIVGNLSTRIMLIFFVSIILMTCFFIVFGYYSQLNLQEQRQYDRLSAIVKSTALSIDGDEHALMMRDHSEKDAILTNENNITYNQIHITLEAVAEANGLKTAMYTMVYMHDKEVFEFGVTSDETPYYRHEYSNFPKLLLDSIDVGGEIPLYEDDHGTWLSAFYPIRNKEGKRVAVLQADIEFTEFIAMVRARYLKESLIALAAIILLSLILIPYTRKVLREDEKQKQKLRVQAEIIEEKNKDITDSINYALKIQNTILPPLAQFYDVFSDFGLLYKPKDIIAGDFYYLEKIENYVYVAAADCTGHGVPGAMVSVICSNAMSYAINEKKLKSTNEILDQVREIVVEKFQFSPDGIKDGMDISLCRFDIETNELEYSGANSAIYIFNEGQIEKMLPDKQPIGQFDHGKPFTAQKKTLQKGSLVYLFTDGFADQFGGVKGKKLKYETFKSMLIEIDDTSLSDLMGELDKRFESWRGDFEQVDDVCVIGIRV